MKQSSVGSFEPAIFIVDDDPAVRDSLQQLLESIGFTVETYGSGESFLEQASLPDRACVLLDLKLPGLNGLEVLETLAARHSDACVILITGHGDAATKARAIRAGAAAMLEKPLRDELLLGTILSVFEHRQERRGNGA
ncbi:MAG: response regulator [Proteobacteria bacterium]|nr:response regulator [Pseudomonadota bacterium]